jgi:hypothetical protein
MIVVIDTQFMENYGAHDWDGQGECPQYWKMKGGSSYKVRNVPSDADIKAVVDLVAPEFVHDDIGSREYIIGYSMENDDFLSWFEKSQLDYDGKITCPEPSFEYDELSTLAMIRLKEDEMRVEELAAEGL